MESKPVLAIFDFDKTITTKDSYNDFFIKQFGLIRFVLFMLKNAFNIFLYIIGVYDNHIIKEKMLLGFFKDMPYDGFVKKCEEYSKQDLIKIINPVALKKISWHKENNHELVLLSASLGEWINLPI